MLTHLSIRNIVLIESSELDFARGLCVLTGETGAGKSILLDALGLALGARGDASLVRHGEAQGAVAAEFDISGNVPAKAMLAELGLSAEDTLIVRRTLSADGKGRVLVNDQPVGVTALKRLGETLVEVHGQHDQRGLMDASTHRGLLDQFGRHGAALTKVALAHAAWKTAANALAALHEKIEQSKREEEFLRHMAKELSALAPEPGEEQALADQRIAMMQSEKMFETLNEAIGELSVGKGVSMAIRSAQRTLTRSPLAGTGKFDAVLEALDRAANDADAAVDQLEAMGKETPYDQRKLEEIEERLFALKAAARKYNLPAEELPGLLAEVDTKLALIDSRGGELARVTKEEAAAKAEYAVLAKQLTEARAKTALRLTKAIEAELTPLKMSGTKFRVHITPMPEGNWGAHGADAVAFEAATNVAKGAEIPYAPVVKIASGGELSRFMLAMKVALSEVRSTPTLIFDEIDTGTGGAVADAIGARLARLGEEAQVLVVTHLPQVAARGSQHFTIAKQEKKGRVTTSVTALAQSERKEELARMLAGSEVTAEARKAAQKLLETAA